MKSILAILLLASSAFAADKALPRTIPATVTATPFTNWTGVTIQNRELGILATNYQAHVVFEGATNVLDLKLKVSEVAVWRVPQSPIYMTNSVIQNAIPWGFSR